MNFYGIRELSNNTKAVLSNVTNGNKVVITDNGKPTAIMINITEENFEFVLDAINRIELLKKLKESEEELKSGVECRDAFDVLGDLKAKYGKV